MIREIAFSAVCLLDTIEANVDNDRLSDSQFREFIRNSLSVVRDASDRSRAAYPMNLTENKKHRLIDLATRDEDK